MNKQAQFMASMSSLIDKTTLLEHTQLDEQLAGYKPAEVHTIEFIGNHPDANVTIIANAMYVTRGAVSKMTRRLMKNALIERYQKPDNKKEIYFRLTAKARTCTTRTPPLIANLRTVTPRCLRKPTNHSLMIHWPF
ncbi:MarR family transcriptional regulator [Secundilactobacillus paracollinoides]|uniref:MarR family transcriptional regulator n=1 Tax=Secundilactobacillus paracollinoides TaxID=240427 RepID=UPI001CDAEE81|nr:MarR family transcriptional regulator [Secundilactobacillus paracollinoides]